MIQRIQTVYFLVAFVLIALSLFGLPLYEVKLDKLGVMVAEIGAYNVKFSGVVTNSSLLWVFIAVPAITALLCILLFKDRKRQAALAKLAIVLVVFASAWVFYTGTQFLKGSAFPSNNGVVPQVAFYCLVGAIVFLLLGLRGVNKDRKLIDSLNRLR